MAQVQTLTTQQRQEQQMRMSQQQLQMVKLLVMPIAEFEQSVKRELMDNPALEDAKFRDADAVGTDTDSGPESDINDTGDDPYSDSADDISERMADTIERYGEDDLPVFTVNNGSEERNELPVGDTGSFIEDLQAQMMNYDLDDTQREVLLYLIGLLDNHGYISTPTSTIVDELAFSNYIYVDEAYVEEMLNVLKSFDPPGIGAKDTQECLLLQIDRELNEDAPISELKERFLLLQRRVVADHYDLFIKRNEERLKSELGINSTAVKMLFDAIKKLNINPGLSLGEATNSRTQTQTPDFIIETDPDGNIDMRLNSGDVPRLHVRQEYIERMKVMQQNPKRLSRSEREGLVYTQQKVEAAQMFIESIKQRRTTLYNTMQAIIDLQRQYILTHDEDDKVRMVLNDVAQRTGYDISTVSRVCNSKCCLLDGHIYQLQEFFKLTRKNSEGKEVDSRHVETMLKALVDGEDKHNPLTDDQLAQLITQQGVKLARRTVAKYRKQCGIASVMERKA